MNALEEAEDLGEPVGTPKLKHCPRLGYKVAPAVCEEERGLYPRACERACGKAHEPEEKKEPAMENEHPNPVHLDLLSKSWPPLAPGMTVTRSGRVRREGGYYKACPGCGRWIRDVSERCLACAGKLRRGRHAGGAKTAAKPKAGRKHFTAKEQIAMAAARVQAPARPHFNDASERAAATVAALAGASTFPDSIDARPFSPVQAAIVHECDEIGKMLIAKNKAYGNSALDPVRVFSKASAEEQIKVRLDDKLSRLMRGEAAGEDAVLDLIGYLVLLRVHQALERNRKAEAEAAP